MWKLILKRSEDIFLLMSDEIFLGFDGGATKTSGVAIDSNRNVIAEATGGPSNFQIIGTERASENIFATTELILGKGALHASNIKSIYLGLSGAGRIGDADRMRDAFLEFLGGRNFPPAEVRIGSDAIAALEGAFSGNPGMILISGTGSILFAKDEAERIHRVGGWGRFIGDEGSAYALGRACLSAVARQMDGRGARTLMSVLLKDRRQIENQPTMITEVYRNNLDIASLAPIVIDAAEAGDEIALQIVRTAARDLLEHVRAAFDILQKPFPLALIGSVLTGQNPLSKTFMELMREFFPHIEIRKPDHSPAMGAALLALKIKGKK
jgi:N-acetylglucosamine kinase-like BadF-type ATPase